MGKGFGAVGGVVDLDGAAGKGHVRTGFGNGDPLVLADLADLLGGATDDAQAAGVG